MEHLEHYSSLFLFFVGGFLHLPPWAILSKKGYSCAKGTWLAGAGRIITRNGTRSRGRAYSSEPCVLGFPSVCLLYHGPALQDSEPELPRLWSGVGGHWLRLEDGVGGSLQTPEASLALLQQGVPDGDPAVLQRGGGRRALRLPHLRLPLPAAGHAGDGGSLRPAGPGRRAGVLCLREARTGRPALDLTRQGVTHLPHLHGPRGFVGAFAAGAVYPRQRLVR